MWTRKELKNRAKTILKMNYWKTVLVAFLVMVLSSAGAGATGGAASHTGREEGVVQTETLSQEQLDELNAQLTETTVESESIDELPPIVAETLGMEDVGAKPKLPAGLVAFIAIVTFVVLLLLLVVTIAMEAFVVNPLHVGTARFFCRNLTERAEVKEVAWSYDHNYSETVRTMFWRDIYTLLWALLLIVPGIVKAYEYCMIPYLLADDPTLTKRQAFAQSKAMMTGNKWRAFVLDLSFLGWDLLSLLTLGVLEVFYVGPYRCMTKAALYDELRYGKSAPVMGAHAAGIPTPVSGTPGAPVDPWSD